MKKTKQKKLLNIKKDDVKKITPDEFDSVVRTILSVPPQTKDKEKIKNSRKNYKDK